jgi:hypothetical protein
VEFPAVSLPRGNFDADVETAGDIQIEANDLLFAVNEAVGGQGLRCAEPSSLAPPQSPLRFRRSEATRRDARRGCHIQLRFKFATATGIRVPEMWSFHAITPQS